MEQLGIYLGGDHGMVDNILTEIGKSIFILQSAAITKVTDTSIEVYQDTALLIRSDCSWFGKLVE